MTAWESTSAKNRVEGQRARGEGGVWSEIRRPTIPNLHCPCWKLVIVYHHSLSFSLSFSHSTSIRLATDSNIQRSLVFLFFFISRSFGRRRAALHTRRTVPQSFLRLHNNPTIPRWSLYNEKHLSIFTALIAFTSFDTILHYSTSLLALKWNPHDFSRLFWPSHPFLPRGHGQRHLAT